MEGASIRITPRAHDALEQGARAALAKQRETCFVLFGQHGTITHAIRAGEPEEHAAMTRPDYAASDQTVQEMHEQGYDQMGQAHVHFGYGGPSGGDIQSLQDNAPPGYLCLVVNITPAGTTTLFCVSVDEAGSVVEHPVKMLVDQPEYDPLIPLARRELRYLQDGLGSGGCTVAQQSGTWGIKQLTFIDGDTLEVRNSERHLAPRKAAGKTKTAWVRSFLKPRTTSKITTYARAITPQNRPWLRALLRAHDIVGECTGHPVVRELISEECRALGKPVVFAGVFKQASGGYVFLQHPERTAACNRCLFKLTRHAARDDRETLEQLTRDYGFTPEELERQIGLFTDVSLTAILQAKVILDLIKGVAHDANLYLIDNQALTLRQAFVKQSATCTNCHPDLSI